MTNLVDIAAWAGAIGSGIMAGVYFAFSSFVMSSLGAIGHERGIVAMQSINTKILSSLFMPLFWATTILSVGVAIWAAMHWERGGSGALLVAGVVYFVGMFVCTAAGNVPLNNALDATSPQAVEAVGIWSDYLRDWTRLNHVRTLACLTSCALFIAAMRLAAA